MASLEHVTAEQLQAFSDHTSRLFEARAGLSEVVAGTRNALSESLELMAEIDAMLAKVSKALI